MTNAARIYGNSSISIKRNNSIAFMLFIEAVAHETRSYSNSFRISADYNNDNEEIIILMYNATEEKRKSICEYINANL